MCILLAGIYGMLHNQITYSISPEYFTEFKYKQFGFDPAKFGEARQTVAVIGFLASWFVGLVIGIVIGLVALIAKDHLVMRKLVRGSIVWIFSIAILFGIIGFFRGKLYLIERGVNWWIPETVINKNDFIVTGSIHNYSYLGGAIGIVIAIAYMIGENKRIIKNVAPTGLGSHL